MIKVVSNQEQTKTGPLPIAFNSDGTPLDDYKLYGTSDGAGVETENLFDIELEQGGWAGTDNAVPYKKGEMDPVYYKRLSSKGIIMGLDPEKAYTICVFPKNLKVSAIVVNANKKRIKYYTYRVGNVKVPVLNDRHGVALMFAKNNSNDDFSPEEVQGVTIIEGSTAPTSYIPYGYKLPMTMESGETENIYDPSKATVGGRYNEFGKWSENRDMTTSDFIPVSEGVYYITLSIKYSDVYLVVNLWDSSKGFIKNIIKEDYPKKDNSFAIDETGYITLSYATNNVYSIACYRRAVIPIYIGDSKLMAEEYADYEEQKIYKRTENLLKLDRAESRTFTIDNRYYLYGGLAHAAIMQPQNIVSVDVNEDYVEVHSATGAGIGYIVEVKPNTTYTVSFDLDVSVPNDRSSAALNTISNNDVFGSFVAIYGNKNKHTITTLQNTEYLYIVFRIVNVKAKYTNIMITEGSTSPETYAPYLQPTDPPIALPELSTYQGENTLSCSEELGDESQITYVGPKEETIVKIMRTEVDGQGNVTEHVLYKEGS